MALHTKIMYRADGLRLRRLLSSIFCNRELYGANHGDIVICLVI